jgi:hypothetical protein
MTTTKILVLLLTSGLALPAQKTESKSSARVGREISEAILSFLNQSQTGGKGIQGASFPDLVVTGAINDVECRLDILETADKRFFILSLRNKEGMLLTLQGHQPIPAKWSSVEKIGEGSGILMENAGRFSFAGGNWQAFVSEASQQSVSGLADIETLRRQYAEFIFFETELTMQVNIRFGPKMTTTTAKPGALQAKLEEILNAGKDSSERLKLAPDSKVEFSTAGRFLPIQTKVFDK